MKGEIVRVSGSKDVLSQISENGEAELILRENDCVSLLTEEARARLDKPEKKGLCTARFKENILLKGISRKNLENGDTLLIEGEGALLLFAGRVKSCHKECPLFSEGAPCELASEAFYAEVLRGGRVRAGESASVLKAEADAPNHFDGAGNAVMVDVSPKMETERVAVAKGRIKMKERTMAVIKEGSASKGDVLGVARIAGIMAAKRTWELIPLCHPIALETCTVDFGLFDEGNEVEAVCTVKCTGKTGVEMEALTGVSAALLTVYDMLKAIDRGMEIHSVRLWEKSGGKSGVFKYEGRL